MRENNNNNNNNNNNVKNNVKHFFEHELLKVQNISSIDQQQTFVDD